MRLTLREIKDAYPERKRENAEATNLVNTYVFRPLSFYIVWLFSRLGISPNATSGIALVVGLIACYYLITGYYLNVIIGAFLLNLQLILDCVDGGLARALGRESSKGYYLDAIGGHTINLLVPISLSIGLYLYPPLGIPGVIFLLLGVLLTLLRCLRILAGMEITVALGVEPRKILRPKEGKISLWGLAYKLGTILSTDFRTVLLILAIANLAWAYMFFYTVVFALELFAVLILALRNFPKEKR